MRTASHGCCRGWGGGVKLVTVLKIRTLLRRHRALAFVFSAGWGQGDVRGMGAGETGTIK